MLGSVTGIDNSKSQLSDSRLVQLSVPTSNVFPGRKSIARPLSPSIAILLSVGLVILVISINVPSHEPPKTLIALVIQALFIVTEEPSEELIVR